MFSINKKTEYGFDKVVLKDETTGTFAEIIPTCSAILHAFYVLKDGKPFNVIESYESEDDFRKNVTSKGFLGTKLSPFVCRINKGKYNFEGKEYSIEKYMDHDNALHGMLYDQPFRILDQQANEEGAYVSMMHEYRAMDPGYPFFYDCVVTYELKKDNILNVITEVINRDENKIPIQDGWHPYFKLDGKIDELELQFHSRNLVEFNSSLIPTGNFRTFDEFNSFKKLGSKGLDNCFELNFDEPQPMCGLKNKEGKIQLEISPDESYPYLQIYTPPHRNSIAIENISSVPDAFNNSIGLKFLSHLQSTTFKTSYKITLLT